MKYSRWNSIKCFLPGYFSSEKKNIQMCHHFLPTQAENQNTAPYTLKCYHHITWDKSVPLFSSVEVQTQPSSRTYDHLGEPWRMLISGPRRVRIYRLQPDDVWVIHSAIFKWNCIPRKGDLILVGKIPCINGNLVMLQFCCCCFFFFWKGLFNLILQTLFNLLLAANPCLTFTFILSLLAVLADVNGHSSPFCTFLVVCIYKRLC